MRLSLKHLLHYRALLTCLLAGLLAHHAAGAASLRDAATLPIGYALRDSNDDGAPDQLGQSITVRGVLTLRPFRTNEFWQAFLQDDTGALLLSDRHLKRFGNFDEGDEVVVRGQFTTDALHVEEAQMIRSGEVARPRDVWAADLQQHRYSSQLVRITGDVMPGPRDQHLQFFVRDRTGNVPILLQPEFLMSGKGEFSYQLWKGGQIKVAGIAVPNTDSAQAGLALLVRHPSDVEFVPPPPPPPSKMPLYSALGIAALLGLLAAYYWERRRIAERRERETSALLHELKRSQAEIKKQASFAQLNPNPVLEFFADGTLTYWNDSAKNMADRLHCRYVRELLPPNITEVVTTCLRAGHPGRCEFKLNGRTILWWLFPIQEITSVHAYGQDVTEQLNLEAQLRQSQKIESVGQLAAGIAHDFNNMIAVIQGYTSLALMRADLPPRLTEPLQEVLNASERAGNLTRQLLTFSRKEVMEPRTFDLNELIGNLARMLRRLLGEHVQFSFAPQQSPAWLHADPGMLEQMIVNLAVNARDAMPEGGEIGVSVEPVTVKEEQVARQVEARTGDFLRLTVKDTGCGMDEATMKRIFEPFFTTKEPGKGTGLGLATVHGIVKQHGGWIEVSSRPGQGTTFQIFLPATNAARENTKENVVRLPTVGGSETILLVEDDPALRKFARGVLEEYGYQVLDAGSAAEALAIWGKRSQQIRLLFTDLVLPNGMNGWKLAETLRAQDNRLKVIFSTGFDSDAVANQALLTQKSVLLRKPYPVHSLVRAVRTSLDNQAEDHPAEVSHA